MIEKPYHVKQKFEGNFSINADIVVTAFSKEEALSNAKDEFKLYNWHHPVCELHLNIVGTKEPIIEELK